ncbi:hypothetical protein BDV34DRAFT_189747 [Aspergillus parasiticus]|uniref:Carrier domain-containing protein n=1 Tax=Aspergillus parasiticus TaxID=5067 RepID=A0A5N6DUZ8_ASPPA|nr:hypothetical protein BDV34DRAFT_189747 [Aspergillus parasiticus]
MQLPMNEATPLENGHTETAASNNKSIAIVGIGCRFPGDISSPSDLWDFLAEERSAAGKVPKSRFNVDSFHGSKDEPSTTVALGGCFLQEDIRNFDNQFFGIHNREAADMDPQQRKLLEVVFESFESAGVTLDDVSGANVGCYVASFTPDFIAMQTKDVENMTRFTHLGMGATLLGNRISHVFNMKGPSCVVDTACSSSFYALHMACSALENGECDAAVVAGVNLIQTPEVHVGTSLGGVLSPASKCQTFDSSADGYARADGVGALYIKRLDDAIRDKDAIRSIIRSTAVNSNGRTPGISQPSVDGQEAVIRKAYARAGLNPRETAYVEVHGTGTSVGDPIEVEGLSRVFRKDQRHRPTLIGGVKPNLGHGEASSGLLSIMKASLSLERRQIPATISVKQINPKIKTEEWGVEIVTRMTDFPSECSPRRISINSFGFGGANAHGILEEPGRQTNKVSCRQAMSRNGDLTGTMNSQSDSRISNGINGLNEHNVSSSLPYLLPLSANKLSSLQGRAERLSKMDFSAVSIADLAYTLGQRRSHLGLRGYVIARQATLAQDFSVDNLILANSDSSLTDNKFAFVFTGQGAQWKGMARELLHFPVFADTIRQLDHELSTLAHAPEWKICDVLMDDSEDCPLNLAAFAQPITTAVQIGLVNVLRSWSILPQGVIGHSSGEIAAGYAAGLLTAREAIIIAYYRGYSVTSSAPEGAMAAVGLHCDDAHEWITRFGFNANLKVACINSPQSVTISGDSECIDTILASLQAEGVFARKLKTDGKAYHSHHMAAIGTMYEKLLKKALSFEKQASLDLEQQDTHMYSTVMCQEVQSKAVRTAAYWRANLESPVRFSEGLTFLSEMTGQCTFVELGPHAALKMPIMQTLGKTTSYLATLNRGQDSSVSLLNFVGRLFVQGFKVDFSKLNHTYTHGTPRFIYDLPTYPWHYEKPPWNESRISREWRNTTHPRHELLGREVPGGNKTTFGWRNLLQMENVPWLRDHKLGDTVVFPATGYLSMAVEALMQKALPVGADGVGKSVALRHVDLLKALPLPEQGSIELYTELRPVAISNIRDSKFWWEFQISSISDDGPTVRAKGSIRLEPIAACGTQLPSRECRLAPQSRKLWYESIADSGLAFGSTFQHMHDIHTPDPKGVLYAEARTRTLAPTIEGAHPRPRYLIHPVLLDNLFQVALIACTGGFIHSMVGKVPTRLGSVRISLPSSPTDEGTIRSTSKVTGQYTNRIDSALFDGQQQLVAHFKDVEVTAYIGTERMEVRHPITRVTWKPDIAQVHDSATFSSALDHVLSQSDLGSFGSKANILAALDLIVHKNPDAHILCLSTDLSLITLSFLEVLDASSIYRRFNSFSLGRLASDGGLEVAEVRNFIVPLGLRSLQYRMASSSDHFGLVILGDDIAMVDGLGSYTDGETVFLAPDVDSTLKHDTFSVLSSRSETAKNVQVLRPEPTTNGSSTPDFDNVVFIGRSPKHPVDDHLAGHLSDDLGVPIKRVALTDLADSPIPPNSLVISTAELERSILAGAVPQEEFDGFKQMIEHAAWIMWITGSGVHEEFNPTLSLFAGFARAVVIEQPSTKIFSLELDPTTDAAVISRDVTKIVQNGKNAINDCEYIDNGSHLLISRIVPDERMNREFRTRQDGLASPMPLGSVGNAALSVRKPGQLSTTQFVKRPYPSLSTLASDEVVVKVFCVGLNAKDVNALAGHVQTTDARCSLECTGHIVAIGSDVRDLNIGDKVAVMYPGYFGTYETVPAWSCVKLRDDEDLRTMASVMMVFSTAMYALYHRANLQPGESILIHSAAGGVGIATIQLAKLIGAEIFATVGTEEKKQYLIEHFGLTPDHIFNSRDSSFASSIKSITNGRGVDVILNSLLGELLHESWDCLADFGRFVEIGKRDLLDQGRLNMEMFSRGTTFTAFDMSMLAESTSPTQHRVYKGLVTRVISLLRSGDIHPIEPLSVFNVSDIVQAFNHFNNAKRMGKIVISFEDQTQMVPVVHEKFSTQLDPHKSYLLVGCLGGLGRSVSKWMMSRGARKFIFLGRSGTQKPAAKRLIDELEESGAQCTIIKGDITKYPDVHRAVAAAPTPLGGVIQAAMGLNEAIFKHMPREYWLNGTEAKVQGTWNLHNALSALDKEKELDFFVLTSSISGKLGTATESNYCAANNFLDAFARYRRGLGLKAVSLGLGMVSEVGYLHEHPEIEDLLLRKGIRPLTEDELVQIFDFGLTQPPTSLHPNDLMPQSHILTGLEDTGLQGHRKQGYEGYWQFLSDARFDVLTCALRRNAGKSAQGNSTQASVIQEAIASNDREQLTDAVKVVLVKKLSNIMLTPVDKIDAKTPLLDFGMDSMLAAELRQYIFGTMGVDVPFLDLMDKKTSIFGLAGVIADKLTITSSN